VLVPGILLTAAGTALLAASASPVLVLVGATAFGLGFGALQNATLTVMYARTTEGEYGVVSAIWNAAYDGGMAVGALVVGAASALTGLGPAFLVVGAIVAGTLAIARRDGRSAR
jgi:predicted MFS family arabinose efflux permease